MINLSRNVLHAKLFPKHRTRVICRAIELPEWDAITNDLLNVLDRSASVEAILARLPQFTATLERVPEITAADYARIKEQNATQIVNYVRANAVVGLTARVIDQNMVNILCTPATYGLTAPPQGTANAEIISNWGVFWADFSPDFLKAISVRVQQQVDLRDRYEGLGLTAQEAAEIEVDVRKRAFLLARYSKATSNRTYITGTSPAEKAADLAALNNRLNRASKLSRIVTATLENIPVRHIFSAKVAFNRNPQSRANKLALEAAVTAYKAAQVVEYRRDTTGYDLSAHFNF